MNTGYVAFGRLKKVYAGITDSNGNPIPVLDSHGNTITKLNVISDPDYIPPVYDPEKCPNGDNTSTTTTTQQGNTSTSTTTTTQQGTECDIQVIGVVVDYSNPSYNTLEIDLYAFNYPFAFVDVTVILGGETQTFDNLTYISGNPVWINIDKSLVGNGMVSVGNGTCLDTYDITIDNNGTTTTGTTTTNGSTSTTQQGTTTTQQTTTTTPPVVAFIYSIECNQTTTTLAGCNFTQITPSVILPNQIGVTYAGGNIAGFTWRILQNGSMVQQSTTPISVWTGQTFYINLPTALVDGSYTVEVSATSSINGSACGTLTGNITVTGNPLCSVVINSADVDDVTDVISFNITSNGATAPINIELLATDGSLLHLTSSNTLNGAGTVNVPNGIIQPNTDYIVKISQNAQCTASLYITKSVQQRVESSAFSVSRNGMIYTNTSPAPPSGYTDYYFINDFPLTDVNGNSLGFTTLNLAPVAGQMIMLRRVLLKTSTFPNYVTFRINGYLANVPDTNNNILSNSQIIDIP